MTKKIYNFPFILLVMLMMSCTGSYYVTSDNTYPLSNYNYHYYDEYYNNYNPYPFYYYYRNYYSTPQNTNPLNRQGGARPSRTPLTVPRRNIYTPSRNTPNRTLTPMRTPIRQVTPSRNGRGNRLKNF